MPPERTSLPCTTLTGYQARVTGCDHMCKYYRGRAEAAHQFRGVPEHCCHDLFSVAYPHALAMLYGARFPAMRTEHEAALVCPSTSGSVYFSVVREKQPIGRRLLDHAKGIVSRVAVLYKFDRIDYRVFLRIDRVEGSCPKGLFAGQTFEFNVGESHDACPAVFANVFPTLLAREAGGTARWESERRPLSFCCPDDESDVRFRLTVLDDGASASPSSPR